MKTNRCLLIKLQKDDYKDVIKLYENEEVRKYLGGTLKEEFIEANFIKMLQSTNDSLYWVVREKYTKEFMGLVSLNTHHDGISKEISYQFLPNWWGRGYAAEVVQEIIDYAFHERSLPEVLAETQTANTASCRLLERVGMKRREKVQRFGAEQAIYSIKNNN